MTQTHRSSLWTLTAGALVAGACILGGCKKDDGPKKLFEEAGVWSMTQHDVEGDGDYSDVDVESRGDAFLLRFDEENGVVQTAMCGVLETDTPATSLCKIDPSATWFCHCFAYAFEENEMAWREFAAGSTPPEVTIEEAMAGDGGVGGSSGGATDGGSGGADSGGAAPSTLLITLSEIVGKANTYRWQPLPFGLFGSDGSLSGFVFQQKAGSVFGMADEVCTPCI